MDQFMDGVKFNHYRTALTPLGTVTLYKQCVDAVIKCGFS